MPDCPPTGAPRMTLNMYVETDVLLINIDEVLAPVSKKSGAQPASNSPPITPLPIHAADAPKFVCVFTVSPPTFAPTNGVSTQSARASAGAITARSAPTSKNRLIVMRMLSPCEDLHLPRCRRCRPHERL